ncbi:MAG TPA: PilZ domain-containing protein [Polyangiaceae bacterium]|nr:PilZ domain-containing protein [Polyangiaceae bacterium]
MERRRHPRIPYEVTVDISSEDDFIIARVTDISEGGVFIDTECILPMGTPCQLDIDLGFRSISVNAEVAWHRRDHGVVSGMGMRFAYMSAPARDALRNFIALQVYDDEPFEEPRRSRDVVWR